MRACLGLARWAAAAVRPVGPRRGPALVLGLLALGLCLAAPVGLAGPVGAHTELLQSSPGVFTEVGGTVDFIDLVFFDPVTDVAVEVTGPDGAAVDGEMEVADGQIIRYRMAPLELVGPYTVSYTLVSADGDGIEGAFRFSYEPSAVAPLRLGEADLPSDTRGNLRFGLGVVVGLVLIAAIVTLVTRLGRNRAVLAAQQRHPRS